MIDLPKRSVVDATVAALAEHNISAAIVADRSAALAKLKELLPHEADVMAGSSTTLDEIGASAWLDAQPGFRKNQIIAEPEEATRHVLRRHSATADWFLGSAAAVTQDGQIVLMDASGSRIAGYAAAGQLVLVVSTNKIVPDLTAAFQRIDTVVYAKEDARMKGLGFPGTARGKTLIIHGEPFAPDRITIIFVEEPLGF